MYILIIHRVDRKGQGTSELEKQYIGTDKEMTGQEKKTIVLMHIVWYNLQYEEEGSTANQHIDEESSNGSNIIIPINQKSGGDRISGGDNNVDVDNNNDPSKGLM